MTPIEFAKHCQEVATEYGIPVESLEGGNFSIPEWQLLWPLAEKWQETESEEDALEYLKQKAKLIAARSGK